MINNRFNVVYHLLGLVKLLFYKLKRIKMTGYKLYIHEGKGHYTGSCVIVIAGSLMMAEKIIRQSLDDMGLSNEELNIIEKELIAESVLYELSGGVKDAANYVKDSAVQLVTGTTSMVTGAAKGIWQAAGAIMRGDLKKLWNLLTSGFLAFGRYIRMVMYNPIGSIIDAILVFTGVGKAVQWIPWAIIVAVDIYEVIKNDFELIPGDNKDPWVLFMRSLAIGFDIIGLVTTGAAALSGRAMLNTLKALPKEQVAQYLAKNPSIKNYINGMLSGVGKVPGFLQKAVDLIKPFLPGVAKFLTNMLGNFSKLVNMLKQGLMSLTVKQGLKIAGKELAIDYGAQKAIETGLSMSQKGKEGQAAAAPSQFGGGEAGGAGGGTTYSPPQELPKPDAKTKSFVSDIMTNY